MRSVSGGRYRPRWRGDADASRGGLACHATRLDPYRVGRWRWCCRIGARDSLDRGRSPFGVGAQEWCFGLPVRGGNLPAVDLQRYLPFGRFSGYDSHDARRHLHLPCGLSSAHDAKRYAGELYASRHAAWRLRSHARCDVGHHDGSRSATLLKADSLTSYFSASFLASSATLRLC